MTTSIIVSAALSTPCRPWCGDDCRSSLPDVDQHLGPVAYTNGGTDTDSELGVSARVEQFDLADADGVDAGEPYISIQVGEWDPDPTLASGLLTASRARQFAAALLNLADAAEAGQR